MLSEKSNELIGDFMENSSDHVFDSGETECFLHIDTNEDGFLDDDELSTSISFCFGKDDKCIGQILDMPCDDATEPQLGVTFGSRDEARDFFVAYGRQTGFTVRLGNKWRSRVNNMVIGQDFVCFKKGFHKKKKYAQRKDRVRCLPPVTKEGCPAMLRVTIKAGGRWEITKFVKEHNHSLMSPNKVPWPVPAKKSKCQQDDKDQRIQELIMFQGEKDQRIEELTMELYNERQQNKRRCAAYQEQLETLLKYIEDHTDHLSRSVKAVVERLQDVEKIT